MSLDGLDSPRLAEKDRWLRHWGSGSPPGLDGKTVGPDKGAAAAMPSRGHADETAGDMRAGRWTVQSTARRERLLESADSAAVSASAALACWRGGLMRVGTWAAGSESKSFPEAAGKNAPRDGRRPAMVVRGGEDRESKSFPEAAGPTVTGLKSSGEELTNNAGLDTGGSVGIGSADKSAKSTESADGSSGRSGSADFSTKTVGPDIIGAAAAMPTGGGSAAHICAAAGGCPLTGPGARWPGAHRPAAGDMRAAATLGLKWGASWPEVSPASTTVFRPATTFCLGATFSGRRRPFAQKYHARLAGALGPLGALGGALGAWARARAPAAGQPDVAGCPCWLALLACSLARGPPAFWPAHCGGEARRGRGQPDVVAGRGRRPAGLLSRPRGAA
eukprot:XP_024457572.1 uncharacterized protein LOC112327601 [Populus trichocarpa]